MEWSSAEDTQTYTTINGSCRAMVWRHEGLQWTALVTEAGREAGHKRFAKLEDAWAWCESRIAELAARSQSDTKAQGSIDKQ